MIVQAAVQQGDEDFKLIVDDLVPLDAADPALADGVQRLRRQARARSARAGAAAPGAPAGAAAGAAPAAAPASGRAALLRPPALPARPPRLPSGAAPCTRRACGSAGVHQDRGGSGASRRAGRLKALLAEHSGPLGTVLFYEREGRTIALSERYRVKPSQELIAQIEALLGKGAAVVK